MRAAKAASLRPESSPHGITTVLLSYKADKYQLLLQGRVLKTTALHPLSANP